MLYHGCGSVFIYLLCLTENNQACYTPFGIKHCITVTLAIIILSNLYFAGPKISTALASISAAACCGSVVKPNKSYVVCLCNVPNSGGKNWS